jgi:photosystem II stability/assembly factor-like uncharacterized protein
MLNNQRSVLVVLFANIINCANAGLGEINIIWKPVPVTINDDIMHNRLGGEGFQMVESIEYSTSNPDIVYMSTNTSQVWKSTDGGKLWTPARDGILSHGVASLAIAPNDPNIVYAAGTYGTSKVRSRKFPNRHEGVYRTINGGMSWEYVKDTKFNVIRNKGSLISIVSDDQNNLIIFAASSNEGLLVSTDNGDTWSKVTSLLHDITDIVVDPDLLNTIYIASNEGLFRYNRNGLQKIGLKLPERPLSIALSSDGSNRMWVTVENHSVFISRDKGRSFEPSGGKGVVALSISPVNNNLLFAKSDRSRINAEPIVSINGGKSWLSTKLADRLEPDFDHPNKQFWFSAPIAPNPIDPKIVLTVSNGKGRVIRSNDYGKTWAYSGSGFTGARLGDIAFAKNEKMIFGFTDHGIWRTEDGDKGPFEYIPVPQVFNLRSVAAIATHDNHIVASIGSWSKKVIIVSENNGISWRIHKNTVSKGHPILFDKHDANTIYAGNYISIDKGKNWKKIKYDIRSIDENSIIYAVNGGGKKFSIVSSVDKGKTWRVESEQIPYSSIVVRDIAVSKGGSKCIYVATSFGILLIKDGRYSLIDDASGLELDPYGSLYVSDVAVDNRHHLVYAARRSPGRGQANGVFVTTDKGYSWFNINGNLGKYLSVWKLCIDPYTSDVYIGTSLGTYRLTIPDSWKMNKPSKN